ncbi:hypothetical protein BaRGS_00018542 [Batillaria attramentaria]|uniref:Uncharacterized protein n=1 Tax=Batillaria attramentaria TaxID=370345 RepID=A0ABD0KTT5_9CAEN
MQSAINNQHLTGFRPLRSHTPTPNTWTTGHTLTRLFSIVWLHAPGHKGPLVTVARPNKLDTVPLRSRDARGGKDNGGWGRGSWQPRGNQKGRTVSADRIPPDATRGWLATGILAKRMASDTSALRDD